MEFELSKHFLHSPSDIKLENVLLFNEQQQQQQQQPASAASAGSSLVAKMTDFGFATESWDWKQQKPVLCRTWCGTAPYYPPQILRFIEYNPFAADCYSMGK